MKCLGTERMCLLLSRKSSTSHEAHNWLKLIPGSVARRTYYCYQPPPPPPHMDRMIVHHRVTKVMLLLSVCTPGWREMVKQNFLTIQMIPQLISFQNKLIFSVFVYFNLEMDGFKFYQPSAQTTPVIWG